jgi:heme/copper-type cytochrome/quinol oxidase subunit 3
VTAVTVGDPLPHHELPETIGRRWRAGVILLVGADATFVLSLAFSYFYLRGLDTEGAWLPKGTPAAAIWVGWLIAAILVASAAAYRWGQLGIHAGLESRLGTGTAIALGLVVLAIVVQVIQIATFPFALHHSAYTSEMYVLAGASLFHLLLTLFIGLGLWNRSRLGLFSPTNDWQVRVVGIWWIWVALAAVISAVPPSFIAAPHHPGG